METKATILASYFSLIEMSEEMKNQAFQLAEILVDIHQDDYISFAMYADLLYRQTISKSKRTIFFIIRKK